MKVGLSAAAGFARAASWGIIGAVDTVVRIATGMVFLAASQIEDVEQFG